ncbi:MAG TPA: rhomboid family intramembrane serine protease [Solirubrobacteraceae bacterium]|jgi:membrane associated rhomboid family serine protease|nr:rhomboid family intramembrane serine protease [Solirubrobacteraceae bacterium]
MIPVKDNIPRERFPFVTVILIATLLLAYALSRPGGLLSFVLDILFLGLFAPTVEGTIGGLRLSALCLLSGLFAGSAWALLGSDWSSPMLLGSTVATLAVLGAYLLLHPHARVLSLVAIPFYITLVEVPAALLVGLWLALQVCFGVVGLA